VGRVDLSNFWDNHPDEIIDFWEKGEAQVTIDRFHLISKWLKTQNYESLLDIGCGNGNLIKYCGIPESKYLGVDSSKEMLKRLSQAHPNHKVINAKFLECDLPQFHTVVAHGFLEHQQLFWESIYKLVKLTKKRLLFNVLVADKASLTYNPRGCWERILGLGHLKRLREGLTANFSFNALKFYARSEEYFFCERP